MQTLNEWQVNFNKAPLKLALQYVASILELFTKLDSSEVVVILVVKIVDDFLAGRPGAVLSPYLTLLGDIFKLGTVRHGPGKFCFHCMWIMQHDNLYEKNDSYNELEAIGAYLVTRVYCIQIKGPMNVLEKRVSVSDNASLNWFGPDALLTCAFHTFRLQQ